MDLLRAKAADTWTYLTPVPMIIPVQTNKPPTFFVENPLKISPAPRSDTPKMPHFLAPILCIAPAFTKAKIEMHAGLKLPIKDNVEGEERF